MGDEARWGSAATPTSGTPMTAGPSSSDDDDDDAGRRDHVNDEPTSPPPATTSPPPDTRAARRTSVERSRAGSMWVGSILAALVLILLLVFILQNRVPVEIHFLGWAGTLPSGVALLLAAVAGLVVVAIPGTVRMLQLRRTARKGRG